MKRCFALIALAWLVCGCTTVRESNPTRTGTEQLLVSHAADEAIDKLHLDIPQGTPVYVDTVNFDSSFDPLESKYAISALREHFLRAGARLADTKVAAQIVIEVRAGALSFDQRDTLLGIPSIPVPLSLTETVATPEIALYKLHRRTGIAKFAAVAYRASDGSFVSATGSEVGLSHLYNRIILFVFQTRREDFGPEELEK